MDILTIYRQKYIKNRTEKDLDPEAANSAALESIYISLLHDSAINRAPISNKDINTIKDLNKNPHYMQLLEDIMLLPEDKQKEYLQQVAKVPRLKLVK